MQYTEIVHPEDAAALKALKAIPILPTVVKKVMDLGCEQLYVGLNRASKIKLSPTQLPELYNILPPICELLEIEEPEFYLEMSPEPNAYAFGDTQTSISITSAIVEYASHEELRAIVAHECGHIACHHMLYHSLAQILSDASGLFETLANFAMPIHYALMYWQRKSELSCDRASAIVTSPETVMSVMARLAGGPKSITSKVNMEEWAQQADEYEKIYNGGMWDKTLQRLAVLDLAHPYHAVRVREILKWKNSGQYQQALNNNPVCPSCHRPVDKSWKFCQYCGHQL